MKIVQLVHSSIIHPWIGDAGQRFEVEDSQATELVGSGFMTYSLKVEPSPYGAPIAFDQETGEIVTETPAPAPAVGQPRDETSSGSSEDDGPPKPPWSNRPKAEWVAYAVSQGHDPDEAAALPKADLMSLYGERL